MRSLSYLNKYLWKYKYRLILGICFIALSNIFAIIPAQIIREAFNVVQREVAPTPIERAVEFNYLSGLADGLSLKEALLFFAALVIVMALLKGLFTFLMRQTIIIVSRLIEYDLKNEIYEHYQILSPTFYRTNNTGDIMNRISEDVSRVRMYLGPGIMYTTNLIVLFTLVISTMLSINVRLTVFSLLPLPVLSVIIYYVSNIINKKSEGVQAQLSEISSAAQESFSGIRVLKSYVREAYAVSQYDVKSNKYRELALSLVRVESLFLPVMMVLIGLSTILTVFVGGMEAIAGKIEIGNIAEFVIYVNMLTWPVTALGWVTSLTQRAAASQRRINEFLKVDEEFRSKGSRKPELNGNIAFENVSFTYPDSGIRAVSNVSFNLRSGGSLGIIGRTGSGKSSLVDLLCRNIVPEEGIIRYDGIDLNELEVSSFRAQLGVVPQEGFLFSDTVYGNISFGSGSGQPGRKEVEDAARKAEIYGNIMEFPGKFETVVGERGITLSGGQKQRISIARAIIRDPKIMIFDDCLSAVDTITEKNILKNLKKMMSGRSSVFISHRVSTVEAADQIIVLDKGKIIERGNHEELMNMKGNYYGMYMQQKLEEEVDIHI